MMTVSLCVVAYNEESYLPNLLQDISSQTYPHEQTEVVLVDGNSTDRTKKIMEQFAETDPSFFSVQVLDNPQRVQAAGWNVAIAHAKGDVIIRIDAHAHIPPEFTAKNMALQEKGEYVTGGVRPCLIDHPTPWKETLLAVENSMFGSSVSKGRSASESGYVKSMFHGAYRREVFEKAGVFRPELLRTEDNDLHYRIRQAGYKLYCDPDIVSYQYARSDLKSMLRQKFGNGLWIGKTMGIQPKCFSLFHFVPLCFVLGILLTTALTIGGHPLLGWLMWGAYGLIVCLLTLMELVKKPWNPTKLAMPVLFLLLHVSYGFGTLVGLVEMPFWVKSLNK